MHEAWDWPEHDLQSDRAPVLGEQHHAQTERRALGGRRPLDGEVEDAKEDLIGQLDPAVGVLELDWARCAPGEIKAQDQDHPEPGLRKQRRSGQPCRGRRASGRTEIRGSSSASKRRALRVCACQARSSLSSLSRRAANGPSERSTSTSDAPAATHNPLRGLTVLAEESGHLHILLHRKRDFSGALPSSPSPPSCLACDEAGQLVTRLRQAQPAV